MSRSSQAFGSAFAAMLAAWIVPPALAMPYVKARCALNGFLAAHVERADAREVADLEARARAELQLRTAA